MSDRCRTMLRVSQRVAPNAPHTSMFLRMLVRAAVLRRGRAASALLAMVVAAAVATAMMNLYVDVQAKLRKEFRSYGANMVVVGQRRRFPAPDALAASIERLAGRGLAVPFAYVVARTASGQSVVVAGTDFERVQKLDRWWSVTRGQRRRGRPWSVRARRRWCRPMASLSISAFRAAPSFEPCRHAAHGRR